MQISRDRHGTGTEGQASPSPVRVGLVQINNSFSGASYFPYSPHGFFCGWCVFLAILATGHFVKASWLAPFLSDTHRLDKDVSIGGLFQSQSHQLIKKREWEIQLARERSKP